MTDNVKHSTNYYHEAIAHAFEMFKNGYEPVMETPFQPRRLGSAFVTEYKSVRESLDEPPQLTIQQKWEIDSEIESEANLEKHPSRDVFKEIMEGIKEMQENPEGCVSTIVHVDNQRVKLYSKEELENMEWSEFKKLIDAAGIRGRRRQNLTRDYLIYQEENLK